MGAMTQCPRITAVRHHLLGRMVQLHCSKNVEKLNESPIKMHLETLKKRGQKAL